MSPNSTSVGMWSNGGLVNPKNLLLGPGLFVLLACAIALLILLNPRKRALLFWTQAAYCATLALYFSPWPNEVLGGWLIDAAQDLQHDLPSLNCAREFSTIVILGGGLHSPGIVTAVTQERLLRAAALLRELAHQRLSRNVINSGGPTLTGSDSTEAEVGEDFLRHQLGEEALIHHFFREDKSYTTHENATLTHELMVQQQLPLDVVLITTPYHLPRAVAAFRKIGLRVCPVASEAPPSYRALSLSLGNGIGTFMILNEYLGRVFYWLHGWA